MANLTKMLKAVFRGLKITFLILAGLFALTNLWIWSAGWGRLASHPNQVPPGAVVVWLGTNEFVGKTKEPTGTYRPRFDAVLELCQQQKISLVIASGTPVQALTMSRQLRAAGVTVPIEQDPYGWRTLDSVVRAKAQHADAPIVFVSQDWHCVRALWIADRIGLPATAYPSRFGDGYRPWIGWLRDTLAKPKAIYDWCTGNRLSAPVAPQDGNALLR
jgi:SanA protein